MWSRQKVNACLKTSKQRQLYEKRRGFALDYIFLTLFRPQTKVEKRPLNWPKSKELCYHLGLYSYKVGKFGIFTKHLATGGFIKKREFLMQDTYLDSDFSLLLSLECAIMLNVLCNLWTNFEFRITAKIYKSRGRISENPHFQPSKW